MLSWAWQVACRLKRNHSIRSDKLLVWSVCVFKVLVIVDCQQTVVIGCSSVLGWWPVAVDTVSIGLDWRSTPNLVHTALNKLASIKRGSSSHIKRRCVTTSAIVTVRFMPLILSSGLYCVCCYNLFTFSNMNGIRSVIWFLGFSIYFICVCRLSSYLLWIKRFVKETKQDRDPGRHNNCNNYTWE